MHTGKDLDLGGKSYAYSELGTTTWTEKNDVQPSPEYGSIGKMSRVASQPSSSELRVTPTYSIDATSSLAVQGNQQAHATPQKVFLVKESLD